MTIFLKKLKSVVVITKHPPSFRTRLNSLNICSVPYTCSTTSIATIVSKELEQNGKFVAEQALNSMCEYFDFAVFMAVGEISMPQTSFTCTNLLIAFVTTPFPQPASKVLPFT